jgi:hypothetical protein
MALLCFCGASLAFAQDPASTAKAPQANAAKRSQEKSQSSSKPNAQARPSSSATRADRLDLDTTVVTGNRELPKVLYIVPWKKAEIGDMPAQPFNTLLDEVLAPVDRDVFKREVNYFHTVTGSDSLAAPNAGAGKDSSNASH